MNKILFFLQHYLLPKQSVLRKGFSHIYFLVTVDRRFRWCPSITTSNTYSPCKVSHITFCEQPPLILHSQTPSHKKQLGRPTCIVAILYAPSISSNVIDFTCPWCTIMGSFYDFLLHQVLLEPSIPCCTFFYPFGISV